MKNILPLISVFVAVSSAAALPQPLKNSDKATSSAIENAAAASKPGTVSVAVPSGADVAVVMPMGSKQDSNHANVTASPTSTDSGVVTRTTTVPVTYRGEFRSSSVGITARPRPTTEPKPLVQTSSRAELDPALVPVNYNNKVAKAGRESNVSFSTNGYEAASIATARAPVAAYPSAPPIIVSALPPGGSLRDIFPHTGSAHGEPKNNGKNNFYAIVTIPGELGDDRDAYDGYDGNDERYDTPGVESRNNNGNDNNDDTAADDQKTNDDTYTRGFFDRFNWPRNGGSESRWGNPQTNNNRRQGQVNGDNKRDDSQSQRAETRDNDNADDQSRRSGKFGQNRSNEQDARRENARNDQGQRSGNDRGNEQGQHQRNVADDRRNDQGRRRANGQQGQLTGNFGQHRGNDHEVRRGNDRNNRGRGQRVGSRGSDRHGRRPGNRQGQRAVNGGENHSNEQQDNRRVSNDQTGRRANIQSQRYGNVAENRGNDRRGRREGKNLNKSGNNDQNQRAGKLDGNRGNGQRQCSENDQDEQRLNDQAGRRGREQGERRNPSQDDRSSFDAGDHRSHDSNSIHGHKDVEHYDSFTDNKDTSNNFNIGHINIPSSRGGSRHNFDPLHVPSLGFGFGHEGWFGGCDPKWSGHRLGTAPIRPTEKLDESSDSEYMISNYSPTLLPVSLERLHRKIKRF